MYKEPEYRFENPIIILAIKRNIDRIVGELPDPTGPRTAAEINDIITRIRDINAPLKARLYS
jgi:hypothetical protein